MGDDDSTLHVMFSADIQNPSVYTDRDNNCSSVLLPESYISTTSLSHTQKPDNMKQKGPSRYSLRSTNDLVFAISKNAQLH